MLADRIGVVTFVEETITAHERRWRISGLNFNIISFRAIDMWFSEFGSNREELARRFIAQSEEAIKADRAEVILADCGGFFPNLPSRAVLEERLGVPVVDPVAAAVKFAEMFAGLGHTQSRKTWPRIADFKML